MYHFKVDCHVDAPIDVVFARATDFSEAPQHIEGIEKMEMLTDGPVGKGTRFRETRVLFGKQATEEMEVVSFNPPASYQLGAASHGSRYLSTYTLTEKDGGTDLELLFEAEPQTLTAKILAFLTKPFMKSMVKLCAKDLDDLKKSIENR